MKQDIIPTVFATDAATFNARLNLVTQLTKHIQIDFMDGLFVKSKSVFPSKIPDLSEYKKEGYFFEAHLMMFEPEEEVETLYKKGFSKIIIHYEAFNDKVLVKKCIDHIKRHKMQVFLAINPQTKCDDINVYMHFIDGILLLGVNPGKEKQAFIETTYAKIRRIKTKYPRPVIQIDGGISDKTIRRAYKAGATLFNSGSYISSASDPLKAYNTLRSLIDLKPVKAHKNTIVNHLYPDKTLSVIQLKKIANLMRQDIMTMLFHSQSGHSAGSLGMADVFAALYVKVMRYNIKEDTKKDYLYLSNGHICPVQYAAFKQIGLLSDDQIKTLRKVGSVLQGHPHRGSISLIENSGGPLGQGISQAIGHAYALKMDHKAGRIFCVCGDGELQEGQVWEAALFAGNNKLDNLIQIVDLNGIQIDGNTKDVMALYPLAHKFKSFNYHVLECNGNDMQDILSTLEEAFDVLDKPVVILAHTISGKGVSFIESDYKWHGKAPNGDQYQQALKELEKEYIQLDR